MNVLVVGETVDVGEDGTEIFVTAYILLFLFLTSS